jgi:hypothetical protein
MTVKPETVRPSVDAVSRGYVDAAHVGHLPLASVDASSPGLRFPEAARRSVRRWERLGFGEDFEQVLQEVRGHLAVWPSGASAGAHDLGQRRVSLRLASRARLRAERLVALAMVGLGRRSGVLL